MGKRSKLPSLDDPGWCPMEAAIDLLAKQRTGSRELAAIDLRQAMLNGARHMRRNVSTGKHEHGEPTYWGDHLIDVMIAPGAVTYWWIGGRNDALGDIPDELVEDFVFYIWQEDLDALLGDVGAPVR